MPNETTDEVLKRREFLVNDCINDESSLADESADDVHQARLRVSMAALPAVVLEEEGFNISDTIVERLNNTLVNMRKTDHGVWLGNDDDESAVNERAAAFQTLSSVPPFSYLPESEGRALVLDLRMFHYNDGDCIIEQGKNDRHVYVTTKGRIMLVVLKNHEQQQSTRQDGLPEDHSHSSFKFLGYLDAPTVVGEYEPAFETRRIAQVLAGGAVTAYRMSGDRFLQLLKHPAFKLKMALGM